MTTPIARLSRWMVHRLHGVPDGEAAPCDYCKANVPPHAGIRDGHVFCSEDCLHDHMAAHLG